MQMPEIKEALPNCPRCGRHCPIDQTSCPRGQELVQKLLSDEISPAEAAGSAAHSHGDHDGHREHGEHGHGHEHGHHHGHEHPHARQEATEHV
ncbi:MAG: hypothetical protein IJ188_04745 [Clostridia bacterium]|nr:hypothetical protein [Clostridia bacterium]